MRRYQTLMSYAAWLVVLSVPLSSQTSAQGGDPPRRALVVINTDYSILPRPPVDDSGAKSLADALRDAHFEVELRENLDLNSLSEVLEKFQTSVNSNDICFFYYSGYTTHELDINYLVPVDYDPSNGEIDDRAYAFANLERGVAKNGPFLSMMVLDASWDTPKLSGQAGLTKPDQPSGTWIFASTGANQVTTDIQIASGKMGFFTSALVKALPQHGLDLSTELVPRVQAEVVTASNRAQRPQLWSTFGSKFYFHLPDPTSAKVNGNDRLKYVPIPSGKFWMGCVPASEAQCNANEKPR